MKKTSGIIFFIITGSVLFFSCGKKDAPEIARAEKPAFQFTVNSVLGSVKIISAAGEKNAAAGDTVAVSDTIITGKKALADLTYGTSGIIRINESSRVSIALIAGKASALTRLKLDRGKLFVILGRLLNTEFKVMTPTAVASVRGTSFTVSANDTKGTRFSVMKGVVDVAPVKNGEAIEGKKISVYAGQKTDYISDKTVEQVISNDIALSATTMTEAEIVEIKKETSGIRIDEIRQIDEDIKKEIIQDILQVDPMMLIQQANNTTAIQTAKTPIKVQEGTKPKKKVEDEQQAAEQKKLEETKKEEQLRLENERIRKREEQIKKEKASNIPTL